MCKDRVRCCAGGVQGFREAGATGVGSSVLECGESDEEGVVVCVGLVVFLGRARPGGTRESAEFA